MSQLRIRRRRAGNVESLVWVVVASTIFVAACQEGNDNTARTAPEPEHQASEKPTGAGGGWLEAPPTLVDFVHFNGRHGTDHLAEITCGGGALFDADMDGDLDVYLPQGRFLGGADDRALDPVPTNHGGRLFINELVGRAGGGELAFTDITETAGLTSRTDRVGLADYGCGAAAGDFDNDGHVDLLVLTLGVNRLWRNQGPDGAGRPRFEDVTERTGLGLASSSSVAGVWFDYDRDGWLDLFVANNLAFTLDDPPQCFSLTGAPDYCGPGAFAPLPDRLWRNRGDGTFEDVTDTVGLDGSRGPALGAVAVDVDRDGWMDLYVANDGQPNYLWMNQGATGSTMFEDQALVAGCAVNADGASEAGMGVAAADYDRDGDIDLAIAHLVRESNTLYRNDGSGQFEDRTRAAGLGPPSVPFTGFGLGWLDADRDGWLDLLVVNGAVTKVPALARVGDPFPLHLPNQLFRNRGGEPGGVRFSLDPTTEGPAFMRSEVSRGLLLGDLDNDGDTDALVVNNGGRARVLINRSEASPDATSSWVGVRLVGDRHHPRDMLGAEVTVMDSDGPVKPMIRRWVGTDGSYGASRDPRLLMGLDPNVDVAGGVTLGVRWPDGQSEIFEAVPSGRYTSLHQGTSAQPSS